ncbi:hypothetical protein L596_011373 [Steinernema carpocapsae]|uniref:RING-type domain-containing protein n=1 Tax=Steinernema carpocapsae TaxID=34508 RepID=A0A4U5NU44_STECR|nr:hypothetical protein L596_011373 [Steinernema carpocapsae]
MDQNPFENSDGGATLMECSSAAAAALMMESLVDFCALSEELPFPMEDRSVALASSPKTTPRTAYDEKDSSLCEMEYPYLDHKPEIGRRGGVKKGKRNTLEAELQRHVANRALLQKRIVVDNGKVLGKRRQARILSECSDDFSVDVPYSLNRRGRWNFDAKSSANENFHVAVVEKHLTSDPSKYDAVLAIHERRADGTEVSKKSKSRRGAKLEALTSALPAKENGSDVSVVYQVMRGERGTWAAHLARKAAQGIQLSKGEKRREEFDYFPYDEEMIRSVESEDPEIDPELAQLYIRRTGGKQRFNLANYIRNSSPVFVRSQSILSLDGEDRMDDLQLVPEGPKPFELRSLPSEARESGIFETLVFDISQWENVAVDELLEKIPSFRWIDTKTKNFFVDLTDSLDKKRNSILVALIDMRLLEQSKLRVIVNGSMKTTLSAKDFMAAILNASEVKNLTTLLAALVKAVSQNSAPATDGRRLSEGPKNDVYTNEVNAERFGFLSRAYSRYQIFNMIDKITKPTVIVDARVLRCEEIEDDEEEDEEFEDDFEKIDMDEVLSSAAESEDEEEDQEIQIIGSIPEQCIECGHRAANEMISIPLCEHTWCRECLARNLSVMLRSGASMGCPSCPEHPPLPIAIQTAVLPMAMVLYHSKQIFKLHIESLSTCPTCMSIVVGQPTADHKHLRCDSCSTNFCGSCSKEPHWPLTCEQALGWRSKFDLQFDLDTGRNDRGSSPSGALIRKKCQCDHTMQFPDTQSKVTCEMCGLTYDWKSGRLIDARRNKYMDSRFVLQPVAADPEPVEENAAAQGNLISAQFSSICTEMRRARFNLSAARDFEKKCDGFGVNPKELRKTVLYLIEFGYAWLYMNRNNKPENWNSVKALLTKLRNNFVAADEVLHRQPQNAAPKIKELEKQIEKAIALF